MAVAPLPNKESKMDSPAPIEEEKEGIKVKMLRSIMVIKTWPRVNVLTTVGFYITVLAWGLYGGAMSSTLLDLEQLTSSTTAQLGLMFSCSTFGALVGAPIAGQIMACLDRSIFLCIGCLCYGTTTMILPWARNFVQLIAFATINGFVSGGLDTGFNISGLLIWGWDGFVYMQGFHAIYAIGTFIGPWLAKPFLAPTWYETLNSTSTNGSYIDNISTSSSNENMTIPARTKLVLGESKAMYVYMIIGIYYILSGIGFLIIYFVTCTGEDVCGKRFKKQKREKETNKEIESENETRNPNQKKLWYIIPMTVMTSIRFGAYVGLEISFSSFLMTFVVKALGWEKSDGLNATAAFFGSFAASRILSIFVAMCISPTTYVLINTVLMVMAYFGMVLLVNLHPVVMLICSIIAGIAHGSFYGCSMSWASKYMHITERIGSAFTTGSWIGCAVLPALAGYLIDNVSPHAFLYMCLADAVLVAAVTVVSTIMGLKFGAPIRKNDATVIKAQPPAESHVTAL